MDLRQAVQMPKRILTKEKIDRQMAGQTSFIPFMNIKDGFNKKVTFNTMDGIEQKIDKLTVMMDKLVTEDEGQNRPFKPLVYQSKKGRGQTTCNYDQRRFQDRFRSNNMYRGRPRYGQDYKGRSRYNSNNRGSYGYNARGNQRYGRFNNNSIRGSYRGQITIGIEVDHMRQARNGRDSRSTSNSRSWSGSRASRNRDRIRCFECREYDHFMRECPTRQASREAEQIQKMFNMDKDQMILQTPLMDTDQKEQIITPVETRDNLNM